MRKPLQNAPENEFGDPKRDLMMKQVWEDAPGKIGLFRRVYSGQASPRECAKAKCCECVWHDEAAIRECTATECPIWGIRPYRRASRKPKRGGS